MTNICVFGAGAIGSYIAHSLSKAGAEVSLIARGEHLKAINQNGLTLIKDGKSETINFKASDNPKDLGVQEYIIITLKAHSIPPIVNNFAPLINEKTSIVTALNGIPWWYFYGANSKTSMENYWLETVDPKGKQWKYFGPEKAIGCVVYPACEIIEPGTVKHYSGDRFSLGEPNSVNSERVKKLSQIFINGGLRAPIKNKLRDEIWIKILGNCSFNLVSALTGATLDQIGNDNSSRKVITEMMNECREVGTAVGAEFKISIEKRIDGATSIVGHKPSTRQDIENSRYLELDAIICSVLEIARKCNVRTPTLDTIASLSRLQGEILGLYKRSHEIEKIIRN